MNRRTLVVLAIAAFITWVAWDRGSITPTTLVFLAVLVPSIIVHEIAHGWAALAFGDDTAKRAGRLTLNPVAHVDPFGTLILPTMLILSTGVGFGYAKPVPVDPSRMRDPRNHSLLVALAGPAVNLVVVVVATVLYRTVRPEFGSLTEEVLLGLGVLNVVLAVFNMVPIPPLDGSAMIERVLPMAWWPAYLRLRQYSFLLLFALFFLVPGVFDRILQPAIELWRRVVFAV